MSGKAFADVDHHVNIVLDGRKQRALQMLCALYGFAEGGRRGWRVAQRFCRVMERKYPGVLLPF